MKIKDTSLEIIRADLLASKADAIVIPVDAGFSLVDFAYASKHTSKIEKLLPQVLRGKTHLAAGTSLSLKPKGFGGKTVILSAVAQSGLSTDETKLRLAYRSALALANRLKLKSIALSPAGFGNEFPLKGLAKIITQEVLKYLREYTATLKKIHICVLDKKTFKMFDKTVRGYVEHILYKFSEGPFVTVDAIIELKGGVVLIERSNPPYGLALPGGFVDYGESLEEAVAREAKEETDMELVNLRQFHTYSKPERDPRFHTIGTVFIAKGKGKPKFGDDAAGIKVVARKDLLKLNYAFDHKEVIKDYLKRGQKVI